MMGPWHAHFGLSDARLGRSLVIVSETGDQPPLATAVDLTGDARHAAAEA